MTPTYEWEWLSDLAIIPAFDIFVSGIILGGFAVLMLWTADKRKERKLTQLQLIEALCASIEQLVSVVKRLARKLEQINALDEADRQAVDSAVEQYAAAIGANEMPDDFTQED